MERKCTFEDDYSSHKPIYTIERYRFRQRTEVVPSYRMLNSIIGCLGYNWTLSIYPFRDINRQICIDVDRTVTIRFR